MPRLFVAIVPPIEIADVLLEELNTERLPRHRKTPRAQVHMTLQFIGDVTGDDLASANESVRRSGAGLPSFAMAIDRIATFPLDRHPRMIAAIADAPPTLLEIQSRLAHRLARTPHPKTHDRFIPHFTLCRFDGSPNVSPLERQIPPQIFQVTEIVLFESILHPSGAEHFPRIRVPLTS